MYFGLKIQIGRCSRNLVARKGSAKASRATSSAAISLPWTAGKNEEQGGLRDVSVVEHVTLSRFGLKNHPKERELQPSRGDMIMNTPGCLVDAAQGVGESRLASI